MNEDVARDLSRSAFVFKTKIWPIMSQEYEGTLAQVEATTSRGFAKTLDMLAGIDAWQIVNNKGMRGIASRVQEFNGPAHRAYNTFTVRRSRISGAMTEYEKRCLALRNPEEGWLYPHLSVQGYVTQWGEDGDLISFAVARTTIIIDAISMYIDNGHQHNPFGVYVKRTGNADFYVVPWGNHVCEYTYCMIDESITTTTYQPALFDYEYIPTEPPAWL